MKPLPILLIAAVLCPLALPAAPDKAKPSPAPKSEPSAAQDEMLNAAIKIGRTWQDQVRAGKLKEGLELWGYSAFDGIKPAALEARLFSETTPLGPLTYSELLEDRCLLSGGVLDPTFGSGGLVTTTVGSSSRALAVATYDLPQRYDLVMR